jgi:hypothetical protein
MSVVTVIDKEYECIYFAVYSRIVRETSEYKERNGIYLQTYGGEQKAAT